jgi:methylated-DNA-[protein]-cysteine S-methyltransferase
MQVFVLSHSPLGPLWGQLNATGAVSHLHWGQPPNNSQPQPHPATTQLAEYFAGTRQQFQLALAPQGSPYQQQVWRALQGIPHGHTRTYGQLATNLGSHPRPLGGANGRNPLPILIPCHRVVAAQGLGGYSGQGGTATKAWLLQHEGAPLPA